MKSKSLLLEFAEESDSLDSSDDKQYVIVDWYLQQHGSFNSGSRSRLLKNQIDY